MSYYQDTKKEKAAGKPCSLLKTIKLVLLNFISKILNEWISHQENKRYNQAVNGQ